MKTPHENPPYPGDKPGNAFSRWLKTSITARMLMVGFLILILLIPLAYIKDLIRERKARQQEVVREIGEKWGDRVLVYGPMLKVPYKTYTETLKYDEGTKTHTKERHTHIKYAYLFPESLTARAGVEAKTLRRGNYESAVFTADMGFTGHFILPDLSEKDIDEEDILWAKATAILKTSNVKGIRNELSFTLDGCPYPFETHFSEHSPQISGQLEALETGFLGLGSETEPRALGFSFELNCNGSGEIMLIPVGNTTEMQMTSNWPDPSFDGHFLPADDTRQISEEGFSAGWKVLHINRAFSQLHLNRIPNLEGFAFGTKFIVVADEYQKSERSAKYGYLVIALTFLLFFLIQTVSKIPIHPFQYLMIGLALTMFYTLLISISEHSNFLSAYLIACVSVVVLISLYSRSILKGVKFPVYIGLSLAGLYSFLLVIIQMENYSLLAGSIGLFLILATVMYTSRKIDWERGG